MGLPPPPEDSVLVPAGYLVLGGLLILGALMLRFRRQPPSPGVVEVGGLYWHFVDLVWLFVFTSVFIFQ